MDSDTSPTWEAMHDEREAQEELEAFERLEERQAKRRPTAVEGYNRLLEALDSSRGRTGLHVKHGVFAENRPNGNYTVQSLYHAEASTGSHYVGRGAETCPISAESIFDCPLETCDHPSPGER